MAEEKERTYKILVYGIEKISLNAPSELIKERNFSLSFEPFNTAHRFNEYDGVILFQGLFESYSWGSHYSGAYINYTYYKDELDKRSKETDLLLKKGGFICFVLNKEFLDKYERENYKNNDLTKCHLNYSDLYRGNFNKRIVHLNIKSDDFKDFLDIYGAASSYFSYESEREIWRVVAEVNNKTVGMILNRNQYFIPSLIPENRPKAISEYFTLLAKGLTSSFNKLQVMLPNWIKEFSFIEEETLLSERKTLEAKISGIDKKRERLNSYKSVLVLSGDNLVGSISEIFLHGFEIQVDTMDELREDIKLLDKDNNPICLCEIKGTNKSVKREYINQTDSHRERSGFDDNFPALLIVNTHIKNARTIAEKDKEIANEQILHAVKMNILILRTIDLLELLKMYLNNQIKIEEVLKLLLDNKGWLRVIDSKVEIQPKT